MTNGMMWKSLAAGLFIACVANSRVNAAVIDFESVTTTSNCQVQLGGSVDGFTLGAYDGTSGGGFNNSTACGSIAATANSGQNYMLNFNSVRAEFTRDVGTFDLISLYVHPDSRVFVSTTVRFLGLDGVGNVLYSLDIGGIGPGWDQIVFGGWSNVKTLTWDSLVPDVSNIAIDDLQYSVPEPATLALVGVGLLGLGFSRRRQRA